MLLNLAVECFRLSSKVYYMPADPQFCSPRQRAFLLEITIFCGSKIVNVSVPTVANFHFVRSCGPSIIWEPDHEHVLIHAFSSPVPPVNPKDA